MRHTPNSHRRRTLLLFAACALVASSLGAQTTTGNLLTNPGAEQGTGVDPGTVTAWVAAGPSNPGRDDGTFDTGINPFAGTYDFYGNAGASGTLTQRVDLFANGLTAAQINAGGTLSLSFYEQSRNDGGSGDTAGVNLLFFNATGTQIGTVTGTPYYSPGAWTLESATAAIPVGTRYVDCQLSFVRVVGVDADGFIDNISLTAKTVPEPSAWAAVLAGAGLLVCVLRRRNGTPPVAGS